MEPLLIQIGDNYNIPVQTWYAESEQDLEKIENAPLGSRAMVLTEDGKLIVKMLRSTGWIKI